MQESIVYNSIVFNPNWAHSAAGNPIAMAHSLRPGETPLLFVGGVHGDEPEGVELAERFYEWLQKNNTDLQSWALIPCLNVDGYRQKTRTNSRGVDLNRNFPSRDWSSEHKAPRYYPGPYPGSEPEVQALVAWIHHHKPAVIVHFHSWEPCVVYTGAPGKVWAEHLTEGNPYTAREDIGYPTPGSLGQWGWFDQNIPVICIEEQEHIELSKVWPHFQKGLTRIVTQSFFKMWTSEI